jgi:hypothetical protein
VDKKIKFEQNLDELPLTVLEIDTLDSRLPAIAAIARQINEALTSALKFRFISVDQDGKITTRSERTEYR